MPRAVDLQLLAVALVTGALTGWLAGGRTPSRRVGAEAVVAAVLLAWLADRWWVHAVPPDPVEGLWPWVGGAAVGGLAGRGAAGLPLASTVGVSPVVPLALASLVGVWAGVPETSAALLAAGVVTGLAAAVRLVGGALRPSAAVAIGVAPVVAAVVGAAGDRYALVGGLLCSATLVVLGAGPSVTSVTARPLVAATALQLAGGLIAARHVGIVRDAGASAVIAGLVAIGLAGLGATLLRRGQGRLGP